MIVVMTAVIVMITGVIVIARVDIFELCDLLICRVPMRLTRASMMETAPEYRVQQHRCDGKKVARSGHADDLHKIEVEFIIGYLGAIVKQKSPQFALCSFVRDRHSNPSISGTARFASEIDGVRPGVSIEWSSW